MVHTNYLVALVCCIFLFDARYHKAAVYSESLSLYGLLGLLLPSLFMVLSKSISSTGIIKTDIAQRFSLIIPILISVFVWNQSLSFYKGLGLIMGFIALGFILYKKQNTQDKITLWPVFVLLGYGFVDVLFKKVALIEHIPYTDSLLVIFSFAIAVS